MNLIGECMQATIEAQKAAGIFRHKEDRWPVLIVLMLTALDFFMYFTVSSLAVLFTYYLVMLIPKGIICAWNHHHQHIFTFRNTALNRGLEFAYALHTGVTTHLWRLHHVLGHPRRLLAVRAGIRIFLIRKKMRVAGSEKMAKKWVWLNIR